MRSCNFWWCSVADCEFRCSDSASFCSTRVYFEKLLHKLFVFAVQNTTSTSSATSSTTSQPSSLSSESQKTTLPGIVRSFCNFWRYTSYFPAVALWNELSQRRQRVNFLARYHKIHFATSKMLHPRIFRPLDVRPRRLRLTFLDPFVDINLAATLLAAEVTGFLRYTTHWNYAQVVSSS